MTVLELTKRAHRCRIISEQDRLDKEEHFTLQINALLKEALTEQVCFGCDCCSRIYSVATQERNAPKISPWLILLIGQLALALVGATE